MLSRRASLSCHATCPVHQRCWMARHPRFSCLIRGMRQGKQVLRLSAELIRGPELPDPAFSNTVSLFIRISPEENEMNQFKSVNTGKNMCASGLEYSCRI